MPNKEEGKVVGWIIQLHTVVSDIHVACSRPTVDNKHDNTYLLHDIFVTSWLGLKVRVRNATTSLLENHHGEG